MVGQVQQAFLPVIVLHVFDFFVQEGSDKVVVCSGSAFHVGQLMAVE